MASSVSDISSLYDTYSSQISNASSGKTSNKLSNLSDDSSDAELLEACKEFESYFVQKMIEQAKKSMLDNEEEKSEYMAYFSDTLNEALADKVTESGGIGIAKELYESMKRNGI